MKPEMSWKFRNNTHASPFLKPWLINSVLMWLEFCLSSHQRMIDTVLTWNCWIVSTSGTGIFHSVNIRFWSSNSLWKSSIGIPQSFSYVILLIKAQLLPERKFKNTIEIYTTSTKVWQQIKQAVQYKLIFQFFYCWYTGK